MHLPKQSVSALRWIQISECHLLAKPIGSQAPPRPVCITAASIRSYWSDGSNRKGQGYRERLRRWADEDLEEWKRREAAFTEHFRSRVEANWPEIKPWLSWNLPRDFPTRLSASTKKPSDGDTGSEAGQRSTGGQGDCRKSTKSDTNPSSSLHTRRKLNQGKNQFNSSETFYEYDPITMRRVMRLKNQTSSTKSHNNSLKAAVDIPVKTFSQYSQQPSKTQPTSETERLLDDSVLEYDDMERRSMKRLAKKSQIENALDRHLRDKEKILGADQSERATNKQHSTSHSTEDLESLRASNIRSSPRFRRGVDMEMSKANCKYPEHAPPSQTEKYFPNLEATTADTHDRKPRKHALDKAATSSFQDVSIRPIDREAASLSRSPKSPSDINLEWRVAQEKLIKHNQRKKNAMHMALMQEVALQKAKMEALESKPKTRSVPTATSPTVGMVAGEGDMATNVHEFANRGSWFKQKLPSASREDIEKAERLKRDGALVKEIREAYEETYGIIDTNHRQPSPQGVQATLEPASGSSTSENFKDADKHQEIWKINYRLLRSMVELRYAVTNVYGKKPADAKPYIDLQEPLSQSLRSGVGESDDRISAASSCQLGKAAPEGIAHGRFEKNHEEPVEEGYTIYKVLSLPDRESKNVAISTVTGPVEDPELPIATIPEVVSRLNRPHLFLDHIGKLQREGYELASGESLVYDTVTLRKARPVALKCEGFYKIFAYDEATKQMAITITKGPNWQSSPREILVPTVLQPLKYPERFMPFIADLHKDGFKIADGRIQHRREQGYAWTRPKRDVLTYWRAGPLPEGVEEGTQYVDVPLPKAKAVQQQHDNYTQPQAQTQPQVQSKVKEDEEEEAGEMVSKAKAITPKNFWPNPVDGTTLSPTGFVNYNSLHGDEPTEQPTTEIQHPLSTSNQPEEFTIDKASPDNMTIPQAAATPDSSSSPPVSSSSPKIVRREEPVFSGTQPRHHHHLHYGSQASCRSSNRAAKRAAKMQHSKPPSRFRRVVKRMMWCGLGLVGVFYAVGLGISSLFWISAVVVGR